MRRLVGELLDAAGQLSIGLGELGLIEGDLLEQVLAFHLHRGSPCERSS